MEDREREGGMKSLWRKKERKRVIHKISFAGVLLIACVQGRGER